MNTYNYPKHNYKKNNIGIRNQRNPEQNNKSAQEPDNETLTSTYKKLALGFLLFLCFGSLTAFNMKVMQIQAAPSWSIFVYIIPISISIYWLIREPIECFKTALAGLPLMLLVIYAFLSFKWSIQPETSMKQGILLCLTYMIAATFAARVDWHSFGFILVTIMGCQAVISLILAVLMPQWGVMTEVYPGAWAGIWSFKQTLGISMALGIGFTTGFALTYKKARVVCGVIVCIMLLNAIKSEATTAALVSILSIAIVCVIFFARQNPAAAVFSIWGTVVIVITATLCLTLFSEDIFSALGKAPTLTGRTDIWQAMEFPISQKPLLGWGFQAFWTDNSITSPVNPIEQAMNGFRPPDAHSTPKDITVQLGYIGLGIGVLVMTQFWFTALFNSLGSKGGMMVFGFISAWTSICFTEVLSLYPMDFATFAFHTIFIKSSMELYERLGKRLKTGIAI